MKNSTSPRGRILFLAQAAAIAALYAGLTLATPMLSYGSIQFRFAEALTLLPALTPAAIPGLAVGCLLANLGSPYGLIDIVFGTLATLLAAICTWLLRKIQWKGLPLLSVLMPALFNGVIIGAVIAATARTGMLIIGGWIALSELAICCALGLPLIALLRKIPMFKTETRE